MRIGFVSLLFAFACGPSVHSTSATLSDTDGGSGSADSASADGASADSASADSASADGVSAEGGTSCEQLGPSYDAMIDALDRTDLALDAIEADVADVQVQLGLLLGLASDATSDETLSALASLYAANLGGKPVLQASPTQCTGSIGEARENLAICQPGDDVAGVLFECQGPCTVASPSECPSGAPWCRDGESVTNCSGWCTGACLIEAASACDGTCIGECEGECECSDGGHCNGQCTGMCSGTCGVVLAACEGECLDVCESVVDECDAGEWLCRDEGFYCTLDCEWWAVPELGQPCMDPAGLAGAASMTCAPPFVQLLYASTSCSDFVETATALETLAARVVRSREHTRALVEAVTVIDSGYVTWLVESLIDDTEAEPCVPGAIDTLVQRLADTLNRTAATWTANDTLLAEIATLQD